MESMPDLNVLEVWTACTKITNIISLLRYKASLIPGTDPLPLILVLVASNPTVGFFVKVQYIFFVQITKKMHQVSKIIFCRETLYVSGIFCAHHQELSAVHVAISMFHEGYVAAV